MFGSSFIQSLAALSQKGSNKPQFLQNLTEGAYPSRDDMADGQTPTSPAKEALRGKAPAVTDGKIPSLAEGIEFNESVLDLDTEEALAAISEDEELGAIIESLTEEEIDSLLESQNANHQVLGILATLQLKENIDLLEAIESLSDDELAELQEAFADEFSAAKIDAANNSSIGDEPQPDDVDANLDEFSDEEIDEAIASLSDEELEALLAEAEKGA